MKYWRCTVCGYVHQGDEPPDTCPVCGADKSEFVEISEQEARDKPGPRPKGEKAPEAGEAEKAPPAGGKPPSRDVDKGEARKAGTDKTPASTGKASPATAAGTSSAASPARDKAGKMGRTLYDLASRQMIRHHAHPIFVHVPNGVGPITFVMVLLALATGSEALARAVFFNTVFVMLTMPLVLFSGWLDWKEKYGSVLTRVFLIKMICGGVVMVLALALVIWMLAAPGVVLAAQTRAGFLAVYALMLGAVVVAGYFGGKLVFGSTD